MAAGARIKLAAERAATVEIKRGTRIRVAS
jgi:hypothetical protein